MKNKDYVFVILIVITAVVHMIFTHYRLIKKDDYGREASIHRINETAEKIRLDITGLAVLGYISDEPEGFDKLSRYYQMRCFLAPINLSSTDINVDTLLIYNTNLNYQPTLSEFQYENRSFEIIKQYPNNYYLVVQ